MPAFPQHLDFSRHTAFRCLEVRLYPVSGSWGYIHAIKTLLSTIASPEFSEVVVLFPEGGIHWATERLVSVLREMYEIKRFRVSFCLELAERRMPYAHRLTLEVEAGVVAGIYDFLPCPPSVFFRTMTRYSRRAMYYR